MSRKKIPDLPRMLLAPPDDQAASQRALLMSRLCLSGDFNRHLTALIVRYQLDASNETFWRDLALALMSDRPEFRRAGRKPLKTRFEQESRLLDEVDRRRAKTGLKDDKTCVEISAGLGGVTEFKGTPKETLRKRLRIARARKKWQNDFVARFNSQKTLGIKLPLPLLPKILIGK